MDSIKLQFHLNIAHARELLAGLNSDIIQLQVRVGTARNDKENQISRENIEMMRTSLLDLRTCLLELALKIQPLLVSWNDDFASFLTDPLVDLDQSRELDRDVSELSGFEKQEKSSFSDGVEIVRFEGLRFKYKSNEDDVSQEEDELEESCERGFYENLVEEMLGFMHECKEKLKKVKRVQERKFFDWLLTTADLNVDRDPFAAINVEAIRVSVDISRLLVEFMPLMFQTEELAAKFEVLCSFIGWPIRYQDFMVTSRIEGVLKTAVEEVRRVKGIKKKSNTDETMVLVLERNLHQLILQFLKHSWSFEQILNEVGLPSSNISPEEALLGFRQCREQLKRDVVGVNELKALPELFSRQEDSPMNTAMEMKSNMLELWKQVWLEED